MWFKCDSRYSQVSYTRAEDVSEITVVEGKETEYNISKFNILDAHDDVNDAAID